MFDLEEPTTADYTDRPHDGLTKKIIGSAIEVHRTLGPGLLESAYETCLIYELKKGGLQVERQKFIPVKYKEIKLDCGYRLDLLEESSYNFPYFPLGVLGVSVVVFFFCGTKLTIHINARKSCG